MDASNAIRALSTSTLSSTNDDTEKKKALLVYKSNQQSASDDDDDDDDDLDVDTVSADGDNDDDVASVQSETPSAEQLDVASQMDDDEDEDVKDDASMRLDDEEEEEGEDSATESRRSTSSLTKTSVDETNPTKLNVAEIIARRRTGTRQSCAVCQEARNGRRAMLCTNCKTMFHSSCYRKKYSKLPTSAKPWYCPECEPLSTVSPEKKDKKEEISSPLQTARKKDTRVSMGSSAATVVGPSSSSKLGRSSRGSMVLNSITRGNTTTGGEMSGGLLANGATPIAIEKELGRVTEIALRNGQKMNALIMERTEEMLYVCESLLSDVETVCPIQKRVSESPTSIGHVQEEERAIDPKDTVLQTVQEGVGSLKHMLQQLQVFGIHYEVKLIKEIKLPPVPEEPTTNSTNSTTSTSRKSDKTNITSTTPSIPRLGAGGGSAPAGKAKTGASRLYSLKQINKLEDWYQKSSRPEASEIQAMYRIINSPDFADKELQPEGISVKQIRIWFDNRRAKERTDYMRLKMKDIPTADMDPEDVKRMKAAFIDEAKAVLDARVSRMKEHGNPTPLIDAADTLLLGSLERPLPPSKSKHGLKEDRPVSSINPKKRVRIDHVASVRKAMRDAKDAGKNEDELKLVKAAAIERARERLHIPYKNARVGPTKPLGKEEVSHVKMTLLKMLEEEATAEELTDIIELLLSVVIPRDVLIESQLHRQLHLVLNIHKENKELMRQTMRLQEEFTSIIEAGEEDGMIRRSEQDREEEIGGGDGRKSKTNLLLSVEPGQLPGTPRATPDSPGVSPDCRKPRVKFSRDQLMVLERYFHREHTPSKKRLVQLSRQLNEIALRDRHCEGQDPIDYMQIRSWFYKRRKLNQPPQALSQSDLQEIEASGLPSSSSESSATESQEEDHDEGEEEDSAEEMSSTSSVSTKSPSKPIVKRRVDDKSTLSSKRQKKGETTTSTSEVTAAKATSSSRPSKKEAGHQHAGRIFNVKQLATTIEEYEKNPHPTRERLEALQAILNQEDHADENFVNPLGVTKRQIKTWFSNRRAKERQEVLRMKDSNSSSTLQSKGGHQSTLEGEDKRLGMEEDDSTPSQSQVGSAKEGLFVKDDDGSSSDSDSENDDDEEDVDMSENDDEEEEDA